MAEGKSDLYIPDVGTGLVHICSGDVDPDFTGEPFQTNTWPEFTIDRMRPVSAEADEEPDQTGPWPTTA